MDKLNSANQPTIPLVSVVIPFFSHLEWLTEAIDSVLQQTYSNIEIIVINDGSSECVDEFLHKYSEIIKYIYKTNGGPGSARNKGIDEASGKYIAFLDSDDIWLPSKIEKQVEYMEKSNFVWSHCSYETFGNGPHYILDASELSGSVYPHAMLCARIGTPCVIIKTDVLQKNSNLRFNENMRFSQDVYAWTMLSKCYELGAIEDVLCKVRMRKTSAERSAFIHLSSRGQLWDEINKLNNSDAYLEQLPKLAKMAYKSCSKKRKIILSIRKYIKNTMIMNFISSIMYLYPYLVFKYFRKTGRYTCR